MGGGIIPGEPEDSNSYRAELGGILDKYQCSCGKLKHRIFRNKHTHYRGM